MKYFTRINNVYAKGMLFMGLGGMLSMLIHQSVLSFVSGLFAGLVLFLLLNEA